MVNAGVQVFVGCYLNISTAGTQVLRYIYDNTGMPVYPWVSLSANADSYWHGWTSEIEDYPDQTYRGTGMSYPPAYVGYAGMVNTLFNTKSTVDGVYPVIGLDWWGLTDDSPGAATNFGLITDNDNAYDGNCAIIATGTDAFAFPCGGENPPTGSSGYGDFLAPVTATNVGVLQSLQLP